MSFPVEGSKQHSGKCPSNPFYQTMKYKWCNSFGLCKLLLPANVQSYKLMVCLWQSKLSWWNSPESYCQLCWAHAVFNMLLWLLGFARNLTPARSVLWGQPTNALRNSNYYTLIVMQKARLWLLHVKNQHSLDSLSSIYQQAISNISTIYSRYI